MFYLLLFAIFTENIFVTLKSFYLLFINSLINKNISKDITFIHNN